MGKSGVVGRLRGKKWECELCCVVTCGIVGRLRGN